MIDKIKEGEMCKYCLEIADTKYYNELVCMKHLDIKLGEADYQRQQKFINRIIIIN